MHNHITSQQTLLFTTSLQTFQFTGWNVPSFQLPSQQIVYIFFFCLYPNGNWSAEPWSSLRFLSSFLFEICSLHGFWNEFSGNISPSIINSEYSPTSLQKKKKIKTDHLAYFRAKGKCSFQNHWVYAQCCQLFPALHFSDRKRNFSAFFMLQSGCFVNHTHFISVHGLKGEALMAISFCSFLHRWPTHKHKFRDLDL